MIQAGKALCWDTSPGHCARLALHGRRCRQVGKGTVGRLPHHGLPCLSLPSTPVLHRAISRDLASPRGLTGSLERKEQIFRGMGSRWLMPG